MPAKKASTPAPSTKAASKTASALMTRRKRLEQSMGDNLSYQVELAGRHHVVLRRLDRP